MKELPKELSALSPEGLRDARNARDDRLTILFRRWPSLSKGERKELGRLCNERQRLAKYVGMLRKRRLPSP